MPQVSAQGEKRIPGLPGSRLSESVAPGLGPRPSDRQGFSLLELVIVMLVMGLVAAVSYPALSRGATSFRFRAAGRDILNTVRYAREKAITEQRGMRIVVNRTVQQIVLTDDFGAGGRTYALPDDVRIEGVELEGQDVPEGPLAIRFRSNGSAQSAVILLKSKTGAYMRIVTDPMTGGARLYEGRGEGGP
jgi:prepilin-type N-terminal cleavage/methylation domain-containing protein